MAQYAVLITCREILGKEPELAHLHALLAKYQRKEVLFLLAKLNCLLGTWQNALDFDIDIKLTRILLSSYYNQIEKLRRASGGRVLFSRITLLYLAKQACIVCGETGAMMDDARSYEAIGLACLMANDLMLPFMPSPQDGTLEKLATVLPFTDYMPHDQYPAEIARAQKMFDIASQEPSPRSRSDFVDLKRSAAC